MGHTVTYSRHYNYRDEWTAHTRQLSDRARDAAGDFIAGLRHWDLFGTFTYDGAKVDSTAHGSAARSATVSTWKAQRDARRFLRDAAQLLGRPVHGVMAVEPHKSGSMHMHGLFDVGGLAMGDVRTLWAPWFGRHGFLRLEQPRSRDDVSAYCGKYLAKELGDVVFSPGLLQSRWKLDRGRWR